MCYAQSGLCVTVQGDRGDHCVTTKHDDVSELAQRVLNRLGQAGQTLATAESLTGGLVAATLVGIPGASAVFRGGFVVYATELKAQLAGVSPELLAARGPVDGQVARELALGARLRCGADWGIATTGIAGPTPQDGHPVGEVYVAASRAQVTRVEHRILSGLREQVRLGTVRLVLELLAASAG